jgi:malic enzyme
MDTAAGGTLAAPPASAEANSDPVESHEAIVVGAGSAGLAAAVALGERSFETLVIGVVLRSPVVAEYNGTRKREA